MSKDRVKQLYGCLFSLFISIYFFILTSRFNQLIFLINCVILFQQQKD